MPWRIEFSRRAQREFDSLDKTVQKRIENFTDRISKLDDPKMRGEMLQGPLAGLWKYRIGDYRLICQIIDNILTVLVIDIGHRREIYKKFRKQVIE